MRLFLALFLTVSASAQSAIGFHVTLTDGRTALRANPQFDELKVSSEQLERAANDRVLMLDRATGTKWTWLMLSWLETQPDVEHGVNAAGTAAVGRGADIGLKPVDARTLRVRCLRERCALTVSRAGEEKKRATLTKDQSETIAFDSDIHVAF